MHKIPIALIATISLLTGHGATLATADGPDFYRVAGVAVDDVLNIRAEPNPHAAKVGEIPHDGTCVRNLGCTGGLTLQESTELSKADQEKRLVENPRWCKVEYREVVGWVAGRCLEEGTCSD